MKNFKRLMLLVVGALASSVSASAYDFFVDGIYYERNYSNNTVSVTCYVNDETRNANTYSGSLQIPSTVTYNGSKYTVAGIGKRAFIGCKNLTAVSIPNTITSIGEYAFILSGLETVVVPNTVTTVGNGIFSHCYNLVSAVIPDHWTTLTESVFSHCYSLVSINQPSRLTSIKQSAFDCCYELESVSIPETVTTIEKYGFYGCRSLTELVIPASVVELGDYVFEGCSSLKSITLPDSWTTIPQGCFAKCSGLEAVSMPNGVTSIGSYAFEKCTSLNSIDFNNVTTIDSGAFTDCTGLTSLSISNNITTIASNAFSGCSGLGSLVLGSGLKTIGYGVFDNCLALKEITSLASTPPTLESGSFPTSAYNGVLRVRHTDVDAYKAANYWKYFKTIESTGFKQIYNGNATMLSAYDWEEANGKITARNALVFVGDETDADMPNCIYNGRARSIVLTDAEPFYTPSTIIAENLDYVRNFSATGWQPLYVPFNLAYDEWAGKAIVARINNVHQFDDDDDGVYDRTMLEFLTIKNGTLKPNTPYVIKPLQTGEVTFTATEKTLKKTTADGSVDCRSTTTEYTLYGTYQQKKDMYANGYYAMSGGDFMQAENASVTLSPFRTYLKIESRDGGYALNAPKRVGVMVDGVMDDEATAVERLTIEQQTIDHCKYNLSGQKVGADYKGIVVKNGRKILQK